MNNDVNINQQAVDKYTLLHLGAGYAARRLGVGLLPALALSLTWEHWLEPAWKRSDPQFFPAPSQDRPINSFFDTLAVVGGWMLARRFA